MRRYPVPGYKDNTDPVYYKYKQEDLLKKSCPEISGVAEKNCLNIIFGEKKIRCCLFILYSSNLRGLMFRRRRLVGDAVVKRKNSGCKPVCFIIVDQLKKN